MPISNTDLAPITASLTSIKDYTEKLEALSELKKKFDKPVVVAPSGPLDTRFRNMYSCMTKLNQAVGPIRTAVTGLGRHLGNIDRTLTRILDTVKNKSAALVDAVSVLPENAALAAVNPGLQPETKSAVVEEEVKVPDLGAQAIVEAIRGQKAEAEKTNSLFSDFIARQDKLANETRAAELMGMNRPRPEEKPNAPAGAPERPRPPFSFKQFMGGLGDILKALLNPVAILAKFVQKSLPYILVAIAFLKGFWEGIGDELREKFTYYGKRFALGAAIIFGLFKGIPPVIRTLGLIYHTARMAVLGILYAKDLLLWSVKMSHEGTLFGKSLVEFVFRKGIEIAKFALEKAHIAFKTLLAVSSYLLIAAGVILVIGLFVLLVAGIGLIFAKFGDQIAEGVKKFMGCLVDFTYGLTMALAAIPAAIVDAAVNILKSVGSLFGWFTAGADEKTEAKNEQSPAETTPILDQFSTKFRDMLNTITAPLGSISDAVGKISTRLADMTNVENSTVIRTVATMVTAVNEEISSRATVTNADRINNVSQSVQQPVQSVDPALANAVEQINGALTKIGSLLDTWYRSTDTYRPWFTPRLGGKEK